MGSKRCHRADGKLLEAETEALASGLQNDLATFPYRMQLLPSSTRPTQIMNSKPKPVPTTPDSDRRGLSRPSLIAGALLWTLVGVALLAIWKQRSSEANGDEAETPATEKSESSVKLNFPARRLPDFEFQEVMGGTVELDDLKGQPWVASFVFSRCTTSCPVISASMMRLHERVKDTAPDVKLVSITVDPEFDTVDVFRQYSEIWTKGDHDHWKFLTGDKDEIYDLVVNGFGLYVKENVGETRLPGLEVAHTNRVVLVNEDGIPVGTFLGTRDADMVKLRRILNGRDPFPKPGPALTFSSGDGSPLAIEFQAVPAEDQDEQTGAAGNEADAPSEPAPGDDQDEAGSTSASNDDQSANDVQPDKNVATDRGATAAAELSATEHNAAIDERLPMWARRLPALNAGFNSLATVLLLSGFTAIRSGRRNTHRNLMIAAFLTSAVFLVSYLTYHWALGEYTGEHGKRFTGEGIWAVVYQLILWPHIVLAVFVPILAIQVFRHAFAERWDDHRRLAKVTFPIWMFVSITGVVIYAMLYHWPGTAAPEAIALASPA